MTNHLEFADVTAELQLTIRYHLATSCWRSIYLSRDLHTRINVEPLNPSFAVKDVAPIIDSLDQLSGSRSLTVF